MEQIAINILPKGAKPVCHSSQFDEGRQIRFNLFNDDTPYTLSGTETISVLVRKPDGAEVVDNVTNTSDSYVVWDVSADACELSGVCECELSIVENGIVLGSKNFTMKVEEDAYNGKTIEVRTASGRIATFSTNMVEAFKSLKSDINPLQDLHGYSKPWSGGGGKNKANKANDLPSGSGITITVANDGTLTINGTSTETCYIRGYFNCPDSTATYTWALFNNKAESGVEFSVRTSDNSSAGGWARVNATNKTLSFTPSATPTKWQFQISSGITFNNAVFKPMIVSGNTAPTDYEPYSNICPISGFSALNVTRTGKNILPKLFTQTTTNEVILTPNSDGTLSFSGVATSVCFFIKSFNLKKGSYIFSSGVDESFTTFDTYISKDSSTIARGGNNASPNSFILTENSSVNITVRVRQGVNTDGLKIYPMIRVSSDSDTDYEPYNGQTVTVNFGQTVYGGVADVTNGKVTITHGIVDLGTLDWISEDSALLGLARVNQAQVIPLGAKFLQTPICTQFEGVYTKGYFNFNNGETGFSNSGQMPFIRARSTEFVGKTNAQIKALMSGVMLVFELATPIEITTTPENLTALSGQTNNVYGDTNGDTTVEYYIEV